jgi:hypothetical protein
MKLPENVTLFLIITFATFLSGCGKQEQPTSSASSAEMKPAAAATAPATPMSQAVTATANSSTAKPDINGNHVMQYVKEVVAIGSRPVGSPGHTK